MIESPDRSTRSEWSGATGIGWLCFWLAGLLPLGVGVLVEAVSGLDWGYRAGIGIALLLLFIVFTCSSYCAVWLVSRFFEQSTLRVFVGSILLLGFSLLDLLFFAFLHYAHFWNQDYS